jgi:hypothetical protein
MVSGSELIVCPNQSALGYRIRAWIMVRHGIATDVV